MSSRKNKIYRYLAFFMAVNILAEVVSPTVAWAITGGPSQPEVESFEPVGTNQMVDLFTGDFNYNIPLMTVPGPNGGYPINLAYHAGITMEQQASWVGLGWNINAGNINRNMRGLPDDFNGETIKKTTHSKPNFTYGQEITLADLEVIGYTLNDDITAATGFSASFGIKYNNYKGMDISASVSPFKTENEKREQMNSPNPKKFITSFQLGMGMSTQNGMEITPQFSFARNVKDKPLRFYNVSFGLGSRNGLHGLGFTTYSQKVKQAYNCSGGSLSYLDDKGRSQGCGITFHSSGYVPGNSMAMAGFDAQFLMKFGTELCPATLGISANGELSFQWVKDPEIDYRAFGYNNMHNCPTSLDEDKKKVIMDFNREKEFPVTNTAPSLPFPVLTNDIYGVQGQGTGGSFRAYRSDIGILRDPSVYSRFYGGNLGLDVGAGGFIKVGGNGGVSYSQSYSGNWSERWSDLETFRYKPVGDDQFYFQSAGEFTTEDANLNLKSYYENTSPERFNIQLLQAGEMSFTPRVYNKNYETGATVIPYDSRSTRAKRIQGISYKTRKSISGHIEYPNNVPNNVLSKGLAGNTFNSWSQYSSNLAKYDYGVANGKEENHIAEMTVINPDGNKYVYGIPIYNTKQKEAYFNCDNAQYYSDYSISTKVIYDGDNANYKTNKEGSDHFYSSTEIPPYVHSYLLTAVYSPDYVDVTGNGPSEDDLGYYSKFNYINATENGAYKWRTPYTDANLTRGHMSTPNDDKASYLYGEKEIWYLHSVETKTHVAIFNLQERVDGVDVADEHNFSNTANTKGSGRLMAVKEINLYSKSDLTTAIKTAHLEYDYSLCKGIENNTISGSGKLTLKKVWFSYMGNNKGHLSPYIFQYNNLNPNYAVSLVDRWGYYKPKPVSEASGFSCANEDDIYVEQNNKAQADQNMSAWNLSKIILPSGGEINVDYESDDYAYVQDKEAMQMFEIVCTGKDDGSEAHYGHQENLNHDFRRIYFNFKKNAAGVEDQNIAHYIPNLDENNNRFIYFKAFVELKSTPDFKSMAKDYVSGYFEIVDYGVQNVDGKNLGYIKVARVPIAKSSGDCHPIRKAAWQYMKIERPGLLYGDISETSFGYSFVNQFINIFKNVEQLILGYYRSCFVNGYAQKLEINSDKPSFIRLLNPDKHKLGGGLRVKRITINDKWNTIINNTSQPRDTGANDEVYGQEYSYLLPDGSSSGVAEYEPSMGGEENPFKKPSEIYNSDNGILSFKSDNLYIEEPVGESYFPGANVGYSRVIVKSLQRTDAYGQEKNKTTASGITVQEYYTAKDYPLKSERTDVLDKTFCTFSAIRIPLIGSLDFDLRGYSQGYSIILNDMHGKLKSSAVYSHNANVNDPSVSPFSKTEYNYQTVGGYSPNKRNVLNNLVTVLDDDASTRQTVMGQKMETFTDLNQHSTVSERADFGGNVDNLLLITLPSYWPKLDFNESMFRSVVYNKITYQNGILTEVNTQTDNSKITTSNLMFDAETGQPLLTSVNNNFDAPVYTYNYAAHWAYNNMKGIYKNIGAGSILNTIAANGDISVNSASISKFNPGDEVLMHSSSAGLGTYWISKVNTTNNTIQLINRSGALYTGSDPVYIQVTRSIYTNQQGITNGKIVSLGNPMTVANGNSMLFDVMNSYAITAVPNPNTFGLPFTISNYNWCRNIQVKTTALPNISGSVFFDGGTNNMNSISIASPSPCTGNLVFQFSPSVPNFNLNDYYYYSTGITGVKLVKKTNPSIVFFGNLSASSDANCDYLKPCKYNTPDILHADATHFKDNWTYDYNDIGLTNSTFINSTNPYAKGEKGIWRVHSNWVYQVDRNQGSPQTNIAKDGTYKLFDRHKWGTPAQQDVNNIQINNPTWTFVSEVTAYNPYGFETENKDALNIYSSAIYGYNNAVVTSVAANASYYETGYDGFEDYNGAYTGSATSQGHGHITMLNATLNSSYAHTGKNSLKTTSTALEMKVPYVRATANTSLLSPKGFVPIASSSADVRKYVVSAWFKQDAYSAINKPTISAPAAVNTKLSYGPVVDDWQQVEFEFELNSTAAFSIFLGFANNAVGYIDDVRVMPFESALTTYVYDAKSLWLTAELDNRNFATFYNYDSEGSLIQVKKETEKGIVTLKTSRNNVKRNLNQ